MKRRDALMSMAVTGVSALMSSCAQPSTQNDELTTNQVETMVRGLAGVELRPGEAASVREKLLSMRFKSQIDPRVQPSLSFNPEVEP